jgi:hypothetical protein
MGAQPIRRKLPCHVHFRAGHTGDTLDCPRSSGVFSFAANEVAVVKKAVQRFLDLGRARHGGIACAHKTGGDHHEDAPFCQ